MSQIADLAMPAWQERHAKVACSVFTDVGLSGPVAEGNLNRATVVRLPSRCCRPSRHPRPARSTRTTGRAGSAGASGRAGTARATGFERPRWPAGTAGLYGYRRARPPGTAGPARPPGGGVGAAIGGTYAVCANPGTQVRNPGGTTCILNGFCSCPRLLSQVAAPCTVTSDAGSCSAIQCATTSGSRNVGACCVCRP